MRNIYFVLLLALVTLIPSYGMGQFNLVSDAVSLGSGEYQLTPAANVKVGAIWATTPVDLSKKFEVSAKVFYGDGSGTNGGADGMAFVLQTTGTSAIGVAGGGLGYQFGAVPILPHFATELRTWSTDSIRLVTSSGAKSSQFYLPPADNQYHDFRFVWIPGANVAEVYFDGALAVSYTYDIINSTFGGTTSVIYGFTAGTGGANALHKVKDISLVYLAIPTLSEWGVILLALLLLNIGILAMSLKGRAVTPSGAQFSLGSMFLPFDKKQFGLMLLIVGAGILAVFGLAILGYGYEVTAADIPGTILALPLGAYLLYQVLGK